MRHANKAPFVCFITNVQTLWYKEHELHSGSKKGPVVHNPKQAIAIALSEARKAKTKKKHKK